MSMPAKAITPKSATNPNGALNRLRKVTAPIKPRGAIPKTKKAFQAKVGTPKKKLHANRR